MDAGERRRHTQRAGGHVHVPPARSSFTAFD
jgi:hypothetical protein